MKPLKSIYRYLLYMLAMTLKWTVQYLPRPIALRLGRAGGNLCFLVLTKERNRTIRHLCLAMGDTVNAYSIAKDVFSNLGMNLVEWLQMPYMSRERMNNMVKVDGLSRINKALAKGKGVIMITSHFGNWEYLAAYFALNGYKGAVVARKIYYTRYNKLLVGLRNSVGVGTLWRNGSVRGMVEVLKQNRLLGILPDQDTDKVEGIFIDFFGNPAYTPTGPVSLALATGASIVPCFIVREGGGHHIYIEEPLELIVAKDKEETIRINTKHWSDVTERYIRKYPGQWVWMHRRWNTKIIPIQSGQKSSRYNRDKNKDGTLSHTLINFFIFGLCFWFLIFGFWFSFAQEMPVVTRSEEVKGFTMSIVDKGGKEKAAITGTTANILPDGLIEVLDVVARIYGQDSGGTDTLVHTSRGTYNRFQNIITTDQFVRINRRDMVITGTGLEWLPDKERLEIEENVKVEYFYETTVAGEPSTCTQVLGESTSETQSGVVQSQSDESVAQDKQKRSTVITSRGSAMMDYRKDVAIFKKNVKVQDRDATLKSHRMKLFFDDKTQALTRVEAYGNVRIKQPKRESKSKRAVYYAPEDKIVLIGNPRIVQGLDFYTADKVSIYDKGNRVVFEPKAQLVIYASTEHEGI